MTPERWRQVTSLFHAARAKAPDAREPFLREARDRALPASAGGPGHRWGLPLVLHLIALVTAWVPARRAARIDPIVALRAE